MDFNTVYHGVNRESNPDSTPCPVLVPQDQRVLAAGDAEMHEGSDGRMYLLDLARAMPPEAPAHALTAADKVCCDSLRFHHYSLSLLMIDCFCHDQQSAHFALQAPGSSRTVFYRLFRPEYLQMRKVIALDVSLLCISLRVSLGLTFDS